MRSQYPGSGGDSGKISIMLRDIATAANAFYTAQSDLYNAWCTLQTVLENSAGMAGNDDPANSFNAKY